MTYRALCLDYGEKRIGVAISDPLNITAQSLPFILNSKDTIDCIDKTLTEYNVNKIIIGLPKDRDGGDSKKALEVRSFAEKLQGKIKCEIIFRDERYSTVAVTKHLIKAGVKRKKRKKVVDSNAAAFILQGYLDSKA
ncbi:MAG: Holliday junction resolvase RuvX [bacterium]|nr:Holliday junction resolvase RuvX [bacterium]